METISSVHCQYVCLSLNLQPNIGLRKLMSLRVIFVKILPLDVVLYLRVKYISVSTLHV